MIRLCRRRRPRVHIIEKHIARRAVRHSSCSACREHSLAPVPVLTRARPGGHHERHPLAANSNGPPLTRKATLEIYTVAPHRASTPQGVFLTAPGYRPPPRGVCKHPRGWFRGSPRVRTTPGCRSTARGWLVVRTREPRSLIRGTCGAPPPARPAAASLSDTTTARSRP